MSQPTVAALQPEQLLELRVCGHVMTSTVRTFIEWLGDEAIEHMLGTGEARTVKREQGDLPMAAGHGAC